jgi:fatty-acyl-CoA synthase
MLYGDWIGRWGRSFPDAEALVDVPTNRRYTYGNLRDDVHRMANFLRTDLRIEKGDRVAVLSLNRAEYITLFFATSRLGAILVPLNFRLAVNEFTYYLEDSRPKAFFFDKDHRPVVAELKSKVPLSHYVCFDEDESVARSLASIWGKLSADPPPEVELAASDPQLIIYTSGTTGLPKGVVMTYGMITWNSINTNIGWGLRRRERTILHSALFYTAGWNVFTLIQRERITVFFAVPTMYQMMIASPRFKATDTSTIWFMVSGGAPLTEKIFETFQREKKIHLREGYGLTEVGPNCFLANGKLKTVGHPMPHCDVRLTDGEGNEVAPGNEGELLLRGDHVCSGYWNKPEATGDAIREGWFHTGDLAKIDEDGHLSIVGRKKDMLISGGINIYPAEIERVLETHPQIAAAAVIGVPDEKWGEVGKVVIELKPGGSLTLEALQKFLCDRMAKYKIPKYMVVVDKLPRTVAAEKVQKFILKEQHGRADNT